CTCGNERWVASYSLVQGHSVSCGCFKIETAREANFKHGHSNSRARKVPATPTYRTWQAMLARCLQPHNVRYPRFDVDVEGSLAYFEGHGGFCDCEIVFNVGAPS